MARMPNPIRPTLLHLSLPEDVRTRIDLILHSDLEGRVPKGAYQRFFMERIAEFFSHKTLDLSPYGFPQGYFVKGPADMITTLKHTLERNAQ